jgi:hypothetical protein
VTDASHERRFVIAGLAATLTILSVALASRLSMAAPANGESPRAYCTRIGNDDTLRASPPSLASAISRLFHISGHYALGTSYYRCADSNVMLCMVGANLPCGKANTARELPAATQWCGTHPNSDFIPMVVTGHDTPYSWRCTGRGTAQAGAPVGKLDARGFFAEYWKPLN